MCNQHAVAHHSYRERHRRSSIDEAQPDAVTTADAKLRSPVRGSAIDDEGIVDRLNADSSAVGRMGPAPLHTALHASPHVSHAHIPARAAHVHTHHATG